MKTIEEAGTKLRMRWDYLNALYWFNLVEYKRGAWKEWAYDY